MIDQTASIVSSCHHFRTLLTASVLVAGVLLFGFPIEGLAADAKPIVIKPAQAKNFEGKKVSVTFEVKHTKDAQSRQMVFLDSEEDFMDEKNLGIAITEAGVKDLKEKQKIDAPADYYLKKTIRVVGTIELRENRPYIEVDEASQIKDVAKKD